MSFYRTFRESAERWPANIAVEMQRADEVERHSYAELRRMSESVGRWLREQGMAPGARCAILASNSPRWVTAYLGTLAAGGVAVPLDTAFKPQQVATLLKDSGSGFLFTEPRYLENARRAAEGLNVRILLLEAKSGEKLTALDEMFAAGPGDFEAANAEPQETAVILYTSGTTSDPKGVMLTHDNLVAEAEAVFALIKVGPSDALLGVLPLFHALAQMANLLLPFAVGARVVYLETLNTTELLRGLRERGITLFACVPQFFYLIHERIMKQVAARGAVTQVAFGAMKAVARAGRSVGLNLGKVFFKKAHEALGTKMRYLVTGGSRFDAAIGRDLQTLGFDILQAYGLTETSGGAIVTPPRDNVLGSVGKPMKGVEVKILDAQAREEGAPAAGEILIRGRIIMKGYYNRADATAQVLKDGWLHTGDLGYLDARGNLFVTGRKKDVIVLSSGKNIYPEEIEALYLKSPWIKEMCVMGLESKPGEPFSERLHAVVVPDHDLLKEKRIVNIGEVIRFDIETLSAQVAGSKRILSYDIWQQELPRTTTRKLKRFEIQKRVMQQGPQAATADAPAAREVTEEDAEWLAQPEVARAVAVIERAAKKKKDRILPGDNLDLDLGLDSMERVELLVALEAELGASVDESVVSEVYSVRDMVEAVRAGRGKPAARAGFAGWEAVFAEESTDPEVHAVAQARTLEALFWFSLCRLLNLFVRDRFALQVTGLEKLAAKGPYIICPNHQSFLDPAILVALFPWQVFKQLFFLGTSEIFGKGLLRRISRSFKLVPVDPDANLVPAMRAGAYGLKRGKILVLFPEGARSIDGAPRVFKKGAAILAAHMKAPMYPVAIDGFFEAWPRGKSFQKFTRLKVAIGDPVMPPSQMDDPEKTYARLTAELKARVVEMWEELHGVERAEAAD